ncbi:MAG: chorismate mutase [Eubacteriales bacterium]
MSLENLRKQIDDIDEKFVSLFIERMKLSGKVAEEKKIYNIPVLNEKREKEILSIISEKAGEEFKDYILELYEVIFDMSRSYQKKLLCSKSELQGR